jgi:hypothetical protein
VADDCVWRLYLAGHLRKRHGGVFNAPLNDIMSRIKGGVLRCAAHPNESLANAPIMMACDFNARFGPSDVCVSGSAGFDVAGDIPLGGLPWKSADQVLTSRGRFWWQFFRRWGLPLCNDLEKMGGVRGALFFTNHTERGNAMVDGIAVEDASGLWRSMSTLVRRSHVRRCCHHLGTSGSSSRL